MSIFGNQCGQRAICDIIRSVEYRIQQRIGNEEIDILRGLSPARRNCVDRRHRDSTADKCIQHPRTRTSQLASGFIDHCTEEDVRHTVAQLR